jgi:hypothetical protein
MGKVWQKIVTDLLPENPMFVTDGYVVRIAWCVKRDSSCLILLRPGMVKNSQKVNRFFTISLPAGGGGGWIRLDSVGLALTGLY